MDQSGASFDNDLASRLSDRQTECLALAAEGLTSKEIARRIGVSPSTVDNHLRAAADRLQVRGRREAVRNFRKTAVGVDHPNQGRVRWRWSLPPLGGAPNFLPVYHRFIQVILIAMLGTMAMAAIIFTISGVVQVLDLK